MKRIACGLVAFSLAALIGCSKGTSGGPGTGGDKPLLGEAENRFNLSPPTFSTKLTQGESKAASIGIRRGKNFDQDVTLKFEGLPKGVTIDPGSPVIKHGDEEAKFTVKAAEEAAVGDFTVKVTGHPTKGDNAASEFKITVAKN
jgi:uncharacterized membrane protein